MTKIDSESAESSAHGIKGGNLAMVRVINCPSVLTESLFMDTEKDLAFLITDEGRQAIADLHINAIHTYINMKS